LKSPLLQRCMLCGGGRLFRHLGMLEAERAQSADSGAFRSGRVPKLKMSVNSVALRHTSQR
jgi:hypothetical protein